MRLLSRWRGTVRTLYSHSTLSPSLRILTTSRSFCATSSHNILSMDSQRSDSSNVSRAELLQRVTELEQQLAALNARHLGCAQSSPAPPQKKPKKASKSFDASKYNTRLIALKFAYLGNGYNGYEYHANNTTPLPTVEEELWRALRKTKLILPAFGDGQSEDEVCWNGCEYSKCGRTDRGVSAFGQVIGVRVRSTRPKAKGAIVNSSKSNDRHAQPDLGEDNAMSNANSESHKLHEDCTGPKPESKTEWDSISDELPYISLLNRVLPPTIRILAWCPHPPPYFSARFSCKERRYRYFFTNPAYIASEAAVKTGKGEGWLDITRMVEAAKKLEGLHDFRNFCKVDPSKQITNFERRIFHADIHAATPLRQQPPPLANGGASASSERAMNLSQPDVYYFEVHGSAFLWHQVRHLAAILFLVGQGLEEPSIIDDLLDIQKTPGKPLYDIASDAPLVLWDCIFPSVEQVTSRTAGHDGHGVAGTSRYEDALEWIHVGNEARCRGLSRDTVGGAANDGKWSRNGIMEELWSVWRVQKMNDLLAGSLLDVVAGTGSQPINHHEGAENQKESPHESDESARVFDGSDKPRVVGRYVPIMQRQKTEAPAVVNARYAERKGLTFDGRPRDEDPDE